MKRPLEDDGDDGQRRSKGGFKGPPARIGGGKGSSKGAPNGGLGEVRRHVFKVLCTDPLAANLIGPKGSTRAAIEEETGCSLWVSKREWLFPKPPFRLLILHSDEPAQVVSAIGKLVPKLVEVAERDREGGETESPLLGKAEGEYVFHFALPSMIRGKLIGTRGANIQELREKTGAKIFVENEEYDHHQASRVIGSPEVLTHVLTLISEIVQEEAGSTDFMRWAETVTFSGVSTSKGGGDKGDRGDRRDYRGGKGPDDYYGKGDRGGDRGGDRDRGDRGQDRRSHREYPSRGGYEDRASSRGPAREDGPGFAEVDGAGLEAMQSVVSDFPAGSLDLDHAVSCDLHPDTVDQLLGARKEHQAALEKRTGCRFEFTPRDGYVQILITGPLLQTYLAHFLLMKKYHDLNTRPDEDKGGADNSRVAELQAQLAALQEKLREVQQRDPGGRGPPPPPRHRR